MSAEKQIVAVFSSYYSTIIIVIIVVNSTVYSKNFELWVSFKLWSGSAGLISPALHTEIPSNFGYV